MTYDKKTAIWLALLWMAFVILACFMESCRSERVATLPEYHETVVRQHDTLVRRDTVERERTVVVREVDSTAMAEYGIRLADSQRAWLVQTEELRREVSQLRQSTADTVIRHDSIPYPVEVPVVREVEKPPGRWQLLQQRVGKAVMLLLGLCLSGGFLFLLLRHRFRL